MISLSGSTYEIAVNGASVDTPMQIKVLQGTSVLYTQSIALGNIGKIEVASNLSDAVAKAKGGIGINLDSNLRLVRTPDTSPTLPG